MEVGFIGIGKMGRPMVERLAAAGHTVHVHNRTRAKAEAVAGPSVIVEDSPPAIAERSEIVLTCLPTPDAVEAVYEELAEVARAGQVFADHSTVGLELGRRCAARLAEKGAGFCDAPVSGGPAGAENGTLTVMAGGERPHFERLLPAFEAFGKTIRLCGPVGAGQAVKLVNQLLVGVHTTAVAEATVFGVGLGADPQTLLELIGTSFGGSFMMTRNVPRFIARDFSPATPVNLILKDLGLIHDEARTAGTPLPLGALAEQRFQEAASRHLGDQDMAALVQLAEEAAGTTVRRSTEEPR
jgi:3-hydroxyisobutyrate dehydrogenase-like beta-hydroxyacid dehydrogenase